jgi:hypothetical protein
MNSCRTQIYGTCEWRDSWRAWLLLFITFPVPANLGLAVGIDLACGPDLVQRGYT